MNFNICKDTVVSYPGKGECADPVNEDAILERVGGESPGRNKDGSTVQYSIQYSASHMRCIYVSV